MDDYRDLYRETFETLGRRLTPEDKTPEGEIIAAEKRLRLRIPRALADFYRVAGRVDDYNLIFNRLLPPSELSEKSGKLLFMEENQAVVLWGTDAGAESANNPPAYQATNAAPLTWEAVGDRCSVFLLVMLHWAATLGGAMSCARTAAVDERLREALDRAWSFVGEINGLRAYNKPGKAICFVEWDAGWRIFAGSTSEADMGTIAADLRVTWEPPWR